MTGTLCYGSHSALHHAMPPPSLHTPAPAHNTPPPPSPPPPPIHPPTRVPPATPPPTHDSPAHRTRFRPRAPSSPSWASSSCPSCGPSLRRWSRPSWPRPSLRTAATWRGSRPPSGPSGASRRVLGGEMGGGLGDGRWEGGWQGGLGGRGCGRATSGVWGRGVRGDTPPTCPAR